MGEWASGGDGVGGGMYRCTHNHQHQLWRVDASTDVCNFWFSTPSQSTCQNDGKFAQRIRAHSFPFFVFSLVRNGQTTMHLDEWCFWFGTKTLERFRQHHTEAGARWWLASSRCRLQTERFFTRINYKSSQSHCECSLLFSITSLASHRHNSVSSPQSSVSHVAYVTCTQSLRTKTTLVNVRHPKSIFDGVLFHFHCIHAR